jgi:hypothetical protein
LKPMFHMWFFPFHVLWTNVWLIGRIRSLIISIASWGADSHSTSQDIPYLLWNPKICCHIHIGPYPKPDESCLHTYFSMLKSILISSHLFLWGYPIYASYAIFCFFFWSLPSFLSRFWTKWKISQPMTWTC